MLPYERFEAWRAAHQLLLDVYRLTDSYPIAEQFGLTRQTRRAAFSIGANIAEGSAKRGPAEFRRYLDIALGSLSELSYALRVARDLRYLGDSDWRALDRQRHQAGRLLWGLYRTLGRRDSKPRGA